MIDELRARDIVLIRDATIVPPSPGLTVLTGETGAGKSALLTSIKLLMGERADAGAVREGAACLEVEGRFFLSAGDADGTVVRRRVEAGGRGRVEIDGRLASVRELAQEIGSSIDLCGQHEHQRLLMQASHAELLDSWVGEPAHRAVEAYVTARAAVQAAADELERVREDGREASERLEEAEFTLDRITSVGPEVGEYERLEEELPRVEHADALMGAALAARDAIAGDGGAEDVLSGAVAALREAARHDDRLDGFADSLESALIEAEDVAVELRTYRDSLDYDPAELDRMQARMAALRGLMRSYGPRMDNVFERRDRAARIIAAARDGGEAERRAQKALAAAKEALDVCADELDAVRLSAAPHLAEDITQQMAFLQMGGASLEIQLERLPRDQWTREGPSKVELLYRPAPGLAARPLRRIASGGEVSRVMLAIKVVLGEADGTETLVFDEVDAGVGGATAVALAQLLSSLATTHQVLVVTHLAQVAVRADRHYLVSKTTAQVPETTIVEVTGDERVHEIARMLSGDASETSLAHARDMLKEAARSH